MFKYNTFIKGDFTMGKKEDNIKKLETIFREKINPDIRLSTN